MQKPHCTKIEPPKHQLGAQKYSRFN